MAEYFGLEAKRTTATSVGRSPHRWQAVSAREDTEVLVVGGGPVGISLGMDLAKRGIHVLSIPHKLRPRPGLSNLIKRESYEPPAVVC
jgi:ribulose 1,5-bisphosphate synthetase/thiazole synthase